MIPKIIYGDNFVDQRGTIRFNNNFELQNIKRFYEIENKDINFKRGWIGHKIEKRWFIATLGKTLIKVILIDDILKGKNQKVIEFELNDIKRNVLYVPNGYATLIQQNVSGSRLLVFSDYYLGEINDNYKFNDI